MNWQKSWAAWPINNYRITIVITALLFCFGLFGLYMMPKDEFPAFVVRQGVVVVVMPGATSEEIEAQVARPLERYLFTFKEVRRDKTTTTSQNGMCIVMLQLQEDIDIGRKDEVWSKLKHGLNNFKSQLPSGVLAIVVNDDFGDACALLITLESDQRSYRELQQYSDELADRLRRVASVSNVRQYGEVKEQLTLYVDRERLAAYGIGQAALMQAINGQGLTTMAGSVTSGEQNIQLHVTPTQSSEEELMNQIIFSNNNKVVRVRDIATVKREYDTSESYIENNGNRCLLLSLEMNDGNNIVRYGEEVDEVIKQFKEDYLPADVEIRRITDQPQVVGDSVYSFLRDLIESMVIIVLVMMVLFPLRSAIVAAVTIPLSTFTSVGIMYALGIPLNIITLACLIVVLGMIVDNSIVVIDGYLEYLGKGLGRREAAVKSVQQYFAPMMLATVCICAIFFPLMYTMTGEAHDVMDLFPKTITINLMVSLLVAVAVIPVLNAALIRRIEPKKEGEVKLTDRVQAIYEVCLKWTFKHPTFTMVGALVLVIATSFIFPQLKMRQFPFADRNQFAVEIFLPEGEGLDHTREIADSMRRVLQRDERVVSTTSFIGCSSPRFQVSYAPQMGGRNFAQLIVNTPDIQSTFDVLNDYAPKWSNHWPEAYVRFKQMDFLPVPTYEYRFYGSDFDSLRLAAERLMTKMRRIPELEWVHTDFEQPHPIIDITLDPVASAQLGINRTTAQLQMMLQTGEMQVGSIWEGDYEVPIVVKDEAMQHMALGDVGNTYLSTSTGQSVPLRQVADVRPTWTEAKILHRNGERCITVTAESKRGVLASRVQSQIDGIMKELPLPGGVRSEIGGEVEKNAEMLPQIFAGIGISFVIIFFFILFNFKRFSITILCMAAISLSMPGAMIGLWIANRTLGLTSLFGFITLMGIIMRNEILIFEHADDRMKEGWTAKDAAFDAGRRRMVPIFLTTATTAVGVIPMILAGSSFWMPVGITIFAGGIGTLILVVTVLPVVYWKLNDKASHVPVPKTTPAALVLLLMLLPVKAFASTSAEENKGQLLSLNECLDLARQNNRTLQNAALEIDMATEQQKEAFTKYFPDIQANVMAFRAFDEMMKGDGTIPPAVADISPSFASYAGAPFSYSEFNRAYSATLTLTQPLYAGGQIIAGNKLAKIGREAVELQLRMKEKDVLQKVTENYWQIATVKYNLSTVEAADKQLSAVYELVNNYVKAGVTTRNDLLKVKLRQQELASNRLKLENAKNVLLLLLAQQIGKAGESIDIDTQSMQPQNPAEVLVATDEAVQHREEMALLEKQVEANQWQVKLQRGKYLPTVAVGLMGYNAGLGGFSDNVKSYMYTNMTNGLVFGTLSIPIMSWWGGRHAIRRTQMKLLQAQNEAQDAREQLSVDIEAAWSQLTEAYKQVEIARTSVEEAAENLRMSTDQYNAGTETISDLLDAETLNRQARNQLSEAMATYQIRLADYLRKTR